MNATYQKWKSKDDVQVCGEDDADEEPGLVSALEDIHILKEAFGTPESLKRATETHLAMV